ncbi:hypothetical protein P12x_005174 [Tundrisphaera lichenicola]|uniref:hypothetical protein n=1 Tax=Tundrisphaera lichenicola TaxID=2029860 RepID=UPI003EB9903B
MELCSGILSRSEYLRAVGRVVELLATVGIPEVLVAYGFGCDCPDELLYQDVMIPSSGLPEFIVEAEAANNYRVGRDNLHVKASDGRAEFLLCHESDIHLVTEDAELFGRLRSTWMADGHREIYERNGGEWRRVSMFSSNDGPSD